MDWLTSFYASNSVWVFFFIFFAKLIEVSLSTVRVILVNRGIRSLGALLSTIEVLLWVFVAAGVVTGVTEAPLKGIVYACGFGAGVYLGSFIEGKLAFGKVLLQVIVPHDRAEEVAALIRNQGIGVTQMQGEGASSLKCVLLVFVERKTAKSIMKKIKSVEASAMIGVSDVNIIQGGHLPRRNFSLRK